jgi:hypothetical protein
MDVLKAAQNECRCEERPENRKSGDVGLGSAAPLITYSSGRSLRQLRGSATIPKMMAELPGCPACQPGFGMR